MEEELNDIYECLEDEEFQATYKGEYTMVTGKERSVLEIHDSDMKAKLEEIRQQVEESDELAKKKVWKAITGPEDGYNYYWLWVKPKENLRKGEGYLFRVTKVETFSELDWKNKYDVGVSIEVTK